MRWSWHIEPWGWSLYQSSGHPRAFIVRKGLAPGKRGGSCTFFVTILESGLPDSGLYRKIAEAARWAEERLKALGIAAPDTDFGEVPRC